MYQIIQYTSNPTKHKVGNRINDIAVVGHSRNIIDAQVQFFKACKDLEGSRNLSVRLADDRTGYREYYNGSNNTIYAVTKERNRFGKNIYAKIQCKQKNNIKCFK